MKELQMTYFLSFNQVTSLDFEIIINNVFQFRKDIIWQRKM